MKEYCPGTKLFPAFHREAARIRNKKLAEKKEECRETMFTKMCRAQAAYATRRHGHSFRPVSPFLTPSRSFVHPHPALPPLSLSLSLPASLSRALARIFFFNLIYRQFDGRKTRRHFCLSPYPPDRPRPFLPPPHGAA